MEALRTRKYRITFTEPLLGTVPKDPKIFTRFVSAKVHGEEDEEVVNEELGMLPEGVGETGFYTNERGIILKDYHVKGYFKEAGNTMREILRIPALRSKIDNFVFVEPRDIYLAPKPDGRLERPLRAQTMQGPRVTLVSSDYVKAGTSIEFTVTILPHKQLNFDVIERLLDYGRYNGLGQWRNGGFGRFVWERVNGRR